MSQTGGENAKNGVVSLCFRSQRTIFAKSREFESEFLRIRMETYTHPSENLHASEWKLLWIRMKTCLDSSENFFGFEWKDKFASQISKIASQISEIASQINKIASQNEEFIRVKTTFLSKENKNWSEIKELFFWAVFSLHLRPLFATFLSFRLFCRRNPTFCIFLDFLANWHSKM